MCKSPNFLVSCTDRNKELIKPIIIPGKEESFLNFFRELERKGDIEDLKIFPVKCRTCPECRSEFIRE